MSMNLIFSKGNMSSDFPYQTPTILTYNVLGARTKEEQLKIIEEDIKNHDYKLEWLEEIKGMLNDGWELSLI